MRAEDFINQVVATFCPESLDMFIRLTASPLPALGGNPPMAWTNEMRAEVCLHLWRDYDPQRPM